MKLFNIRGPIRRGTPLFVFGSVILAVLSNAATVLGHVDTGHDNGLEAEARHQAGIQQTIPEKTDSFVGTRLVLGNLSIEPLLASKTVGKVEIARATFPATNVNECEMLQTRSHTHSAEEIFFVISGTLRVALEDGCHELNAGEIIAVPAGSPVAHAAVAPNPAELLIVWVGGGEVARLIEEYGFTPAISETHTNGDK